MLQMQSFFKALREPVLQFFPCRVHQQDAEHLVIDQPVEQLRDPFEQLIEFKIDVSSRAISFSSSSVRACRVMRVCSRAFSMPTPMRDAISVSSRLCSSVK